MMRDVLLAMGLLFSTASQLRISGIPVAAGPGELLLAVWILLALTDAIFRRPLTMTPALSKMLIFWTVFAFAQSVGVFVGLIAEEVRDTAGAWHTGKAYLLSAVLTCLILAMPDVGVRLHRVIWVFVIAGTISFSVILAGAFKVVHISSIDFWWYNRLIGWSTNPNQFAIPCIMLVLLSVHLAETETKPGPRFFGLLCGVPALLAGILTNSDSFVLALLLVVPTFIVIKLSAWALSPAGHNTMRGVCACLIFVSMPAVLIAAGPFIPKIIDRGTDVAVETMEDNDQAEGRFRLWRDAMDVALESGMLGFGPGPHLVTKQWKYPPPEKNEAHNTALDLFTQGGMLALLSFLWITALALIAAHKIKLVALTSLVFALFVFSNFHLIARHPIFWFSLVICLVATELVIAASVTARASSHLNESRGIPIGPEV